MTKKQKKTLARILVAAALFAAALLIVHFIEMPWWAGVLVMAVPYLFIGWDILFEAGKKIFTGQVFDECLLMTVASLGALALCVVEKNAHEAHEAAAIMLFYQVGELFQSIAVGRSRKSVSALLDMMPESANLEENGELKTVMPEEVPLGATIVVRPGERVPLDGVVLEGDSELNTASLTGESQPRSVSAGEEVLSGCVNLTGVLRVRTTKPFSESTVSKIMELVENAGINKSKSEGFIAKFARVYTPIVTATALLLALVPPLIIGLSTGNFSFAETWRPFVHAALMFLIVSCPCALVISVPMSFFGGIGGASAKGILIKGSIYVEQTAKCKTAVFDKTGTLTEGRFVLSEVRAENGDNDALLLLAAAVEKYSTHPLAAAIREAVSGREPSEASEHKEIAGKGVCALVNGKKVCAGNAKLMADEGVDAPAVNAAGSTVYLCENGAYLGSVTVSDAIKSDSKKALADLRALGISTLMLTGDRRESAEKTAAELGIDTCRYELLPGDKVEIVADLTKDEKPGETVIFVGDGINDAPVLARADVGFAMGAFGSDAAIEAADVVLLNDKVSDVARTVGICRKTMKIVRQNIAFALAVKLAILVFLGLIAVIPALKPLESDAGEVAVFADVGVSVLAILNAMRAMT